MHFEGKPRQVNPQIDCLRKTKTVLGFSAEIYGICEEIYCKTLNFRANLGM